MFRFFVFYIYFPATLSQNFRRSHTYKIERERVRDRDRKRAEGAVKELKMKYSLHRIKQNINGHRKSYTPTQRTQVNRNHCELISK